jgi:hypothetical protein
MGCLALFVNFLIPGLGTLLFTNRRVQGFIQIVISIIKYILIVATFGIWAFMSEESAKKVVQQNRDQ